jgi:hypothetical protein
MDRGFAAIRLWRFSINIVPKFFFDWKTLHEGHPCSRVSHRWYLVEFGGVVIGRLVVPPRSNQNHQINHDIIISPSVAKANLLKLEQDMRRAHIPGNWWHLSIQDGRMVPKISFGSPFVAVCQKAFPETILGVRCDRTGT